MREKFLDQRLSAKRLAMIELANSILVEYSRQGYRLTLRQLYYQLVAGDYIPNRVQEYSKLSSTMVAARMNGLTDWNFIEDRIRKPYLQYYVAGIEDALEDTIEQYKLDRQNGQSNYIEIWTEKDAVSNILKRVSEYFHIRLMVNRGYSSCSAMYDASKRFIARANADQPTYVLYVGDHDPSGLDMLRDIRERTGTFTLYKDVFFRIVHVALTMEQIEEYQPPANPAKTSDPRAAWYISQFGETSWELDALRPNVLEQLVRDAVVERLDNDQFTHMIDQENEDKENLEQIIEELKDKE